MFSTMSLAAPISQLRSRSSSFQVGIRSLSLSDQGELCHSFEPLLEKSDLDGAMYAGEAQRSMHVRDCPKFLQKSQGLVTRS